jgi:predicted NAD/FAD-binding protein
LQDATNIEINALSKFSRQKNIAYTHSDPNLMPKLKKCWSSWNLLYSNNSEQNISVTYWMNKLQHIKEDYPVFVTLNPVFEISQDKIFDIYEFYHPVFDHQSIIGQREIEILQGKNKIWYSGAYLRYGFHEDGIWSAKNIISKMNEKQ